MKIKLCEGHIGGFGLLKAMMPNAMYRGVPITKLVVVQVDRADCVQCKANAKNRRTRSEKPHARIVNEAMKESGQ